MNPRLGLVSYLAARPLLEGLDGRGEISTIRGTPSALVQLLRSGSVDCAIVSSIEAFRGEGYRYIPGVMIASDGGVRSVLFISHKPTHECRTVALDPASNSGAALLQILMADLYHRDIHWIPCRSGEDPRSAGADGWLRIGDTALREEYHNRISNGGLYIYDLATLWKELTGLPFIFALWLVRPGYTAPRELIQTILAARDSGLAARRRLARDAARELEIPEEELYLYLTVSCRYSTNADSYHSGLLEFAKRARRLGLAQHATIEPVGR